MNSKGKLSITLPSPILVAENWCHTQSNVINFNFMWSIDNFCSLRQKTGEYIRSSTFSAGPNNPSKWFLKIYPKGEVAENKDFLAVYLYQQPFITTETLAKYKISILNSKGFRSIVGSSSSSGSIFKASQGWGFSKFVGLEHLLHKPNDLLPADRLTIFCEVQILCDPITISGQNSIKIPKCSLANDLCNILDNNKFSDVTMVAGEHEYLAHKNILAARSIVFAAMFEHEMEERHSNRIIITDIDHEVLQEMLHFIYTGEAPNLSKMANHLLAAADKYALEQLKVLSEKELFSGLSVETAAETLVLADLHSADQLKRNTIDFIKNHAKEVIATNEWKSMVLIHPKVVAEALEAVTLRESNNPQVGGKIINQQLQNARTHPYKQN